jgi:hypothetical protein
MPRYMGETRRDARIAGERGKTDEELELERLIAERRQAQLGSASSVLDPDNGGTCRRRPVTIVTGGETTGANPEPAPTVTGKVVCTDFRDIEAGAHF